MHLYRSNHPEDVATLNTAQLRDRFLIEEIFRDGAVAMSYVQDDRMIVGGAVPTDGPLVLDDATIGVQAGTLSRREFGVINLGGPGEVGFGNNRFDMAARDGLYMGAGQHAFTFASASADDPARFYIASTPAHRAYDAHHIPFERTIALHLGDPAKANVRTIHQYVHPEICKSAQLLMGMTMLESGSNWNTMPCHTHDRRMEVYFYFDLPPEERVFHFMGAVDETRHLVVAPEQGVIAPSWSIHSGVGTASYSFIWSMAGENQVFDDMDGVATSALR
ncbi:MAG: 5-dehydro-4-deoxy-D-glucuronate isomerase [Hyphomicrobiales bacterium]|nr:5-dehydro-4-deoxy-D-glucuronate isomerase [Hyphomicrobiales bacterium]MCP5370278.1 5-dehydro-4-deoxy-D-glucuronate isomerase [Hyphomicrobiales bacterium]